MADEAHLHYDRTTIALHWVTAVLVVLLWVLGQTSDWLPRGSGRNSAWSVHVLLGFFLAIVMVRRILWRSVAGRALPAADRGALQVFAKTTHYLLYILLMIVVVLGIANAFVRGYSLFGIVHLPQVGSPDWRRPLTEWHGLAANCALGLAAFHAAAALVHHYFFKDRVLQRMWRGQVTAAGE